jgi:hypothetical protein
MEITAIFFPPRVLVFLFSSANRTFNIRLSKKAPLPELNSVCDNTVNYYIIINTSDASLKSLMKRAYYHDYLEDWRFIYESLFY